MKIPWHSTLCQPSLILKKEEKCAGISSGFEVNFCCFHYSTLLDNNTIKWATEPRNITNKCVPNSARNNNANTFALKIFSSRQICLEAFHHFFLPLPKVMKNSIDLLPTVENPDWILNTPPPPPSRSLPAPPQIFAHFLIHAFFQSIPTYTLCLDLTFLLIFMLFILVGLFFGPNLQMPRIDSPWSGWISFYEFFFSCLCISLLNQTTQRRAHWNQWQWTQRKQERK